MTKMVRIENADNSNHKLVVEVFDTGINGAPDTLVRSLPLDTPTHMIQEFIWGGRYIKVSEVPAPAVTAPVVDDPVVATYPPADDAPAYDEKPGADVKEAQVVHPYDVGSIESIFSADGPTGKSGDHGIVNE